MTHAESVNSAVSELSARDDFAHEFASRHASAKVVNTPTISPHECPLYSERRRAGRNWAMATATKLDEAGQIAAARIDAIVAQGIEAGGHRGMFDPAFADERLGTMALVLAAARKLTARGCRRGDHGRCRYRRCARVGCASGTAGDCFPWHGESAANEADRAALLDPRSRTATTGAISGRPACSIENHFTDLGQDPDCPRVPDFPFAFAAAKALNAAAEAQGSFDYAVRWAGQGVRLSGAMPAAELVATLAREMNCSITSLSANSLPPPISLERPFHH
ncbi:NAD(P)H-dependent flavin oxidoreductase YrpB (nitropropane dioxygenase family) [Paraburkholderia youngii]